MRRLLQRLNDGMYYQGRGVWTASADRAHVFSTTAAAMKFVFHEPLPPVQLVLKFEDSTFDIRMPCGPSEPEGPRLPKPRRF